VIIVSTNGATTVQDQTNTDGVFVVDDDLGAHLMLFPGWRHATEEESFSVSGPDTIAETPTVPEGAKEDAEKAAKKAATEAKRQATLASKKASSEDLI